MARPASKATRQPVKPRGTRAKRTERGLTPLTGNDEGFRAKRDDTLTPKTQAQANYIRSIMTQPLTFGVGPAGTGKTYVAVSIAAEKLESREIDKLIITRPVIEAGENLGFLPGEMEEKIAPYFAPVRLILERRLGKGQVEMFVKSGRIEFLPLAFMRGHTLERAFVLLDEAQNTTPSQMKMFLTRLGEDTTAVIDGDITQKDLPAHQLSGLVDGLKRLSGMRGVGGVEFTRADVVRSGLVADIVERYEHTESPDDRQILNEFLDHTEITLNRVATHR